MKEYTSENIRNISLAGQRGCGKTSLADAVAFCTGVNNRIGRVDDGSSSFDYTEAEISRKTTISSKLMACEWNKTKLNLFDSPGHADFIGEFLSVARIVDSVGFVINAASGVEIGTQLQWKNLGDTQKAKFFFVNKMETENANWQTNLDSIREAFGKGAVAVQIPIGEGPSFKGIVDLLHMKAYEFDAEGNRSEIDIPGDLADSAASEREALLEVAAESDDELLEKFFEAGTLDGPDFMKGLRAGITKGTLYPVLFGSATGNIGVKVLLDFIVEYLPSTKQVEATQAVKTDSEDGVAIPWDASGKPVGYVFKIATEGHLGEMFYFRCISGQFKSGMEVKNQANRNSERITQVYSIQGKNRIDLSVVHPGDIGILVKLKSTHTGNTLADSGFSVTVPATEFPEPVMDTAIQPKTKGDEEKVATGLHKLGEEDPTFRLFADGALHQQILYGQGPTHIDILVEKLKTRFGVEVDLVKPRIPYRETIKGKTEKQYKHKKQSGGRGQFGDVHLRIEPNTRGGGFEFIDSIKGGVIPAKFIPAVQKGVVESMVSGGLAGSQVVDVKVAVFYGSYHDVDSSDMAFKIAGMMAFKEGFMECKPILLEPIFNVQVTVPDDFTGDVMGDLSSRRGKIAGMDPDGSNQIVKAAVPQAELYKYSVDLRSMTQGQGRYKVEFSHYEEIPHDAAKKVIEEARREREEESS